MIIYSLLLRSAPCQGKSRRADWIELLSEYVVRRGDYQSYPAYLHVLADQAILKNSWSINYVANIVSYVAGLASTIDEKVALTNYTVTGLKQLPGLVYTPGQLDSLTEGKINVLRNKGQGKSPALLHDATVATDASDYTQVLRMRIKGLVVFTMLAIGDPFVGSRSLDGLQLTSMKTALDNGLSELSKRGYVSNPSVQITTTAADSVIGHASLFLKFHPADQLVQLDAFVGVRPGLSVLPQAKPFARTRRPATAANSPDLVPVRSGVPPSALRGAFGCGLWLSSARFSGAVSASLSPSSCHFSVTPHHGPTKSRADRGYTMYPRRVLILRSQIAPFFPSAEPL